MNSGRCRAFASHCLAGRPASGQPVYRTPDLDAISYGRWSPYPHTESAIRRFLTHSVTISDPASTFAKRTVPPMCGYGVRLLGARDRA